MVTKDRGLFVYAPPECKVGNEIRPPDDELHHLIRVRRARNGDTVFASDGNGRVYRAHLEASSKLIIEETLQRFGEPRVDIYLVMGNLKGDANRDVVDIATQLGVSEIHFFPGEHSEGKLTHDRLDRLERMAIEAMKQCGRAVLPSVTLHSSLADALNLLPRRCTKFLAHAAEMSSFQNPSSIPMPLSCCALIIGPEGGLTDKEIGACRDVKAQQLVLGASRLRSGTAVAAGLSYILTIAGEFSENLKPEN